MGDSMGARRSRCGPRAPGATTRSSFSEMDPEEQNGGAMARRELWRVSPETDRALWQAAETATREIQQTRQRAHHDIQRACEAWAREKYGQSPRARVFAARLHDVAMWTLVSLHT